MKLITWIDILPEEIIILIYKFVYDKTISSITSVNKAGRNAYAILRHLCQSQWRSESPYSPVGEHLIIESGETTFIFYHQLNNTDIIDYSFGPLIWESSPCSLELEKSIIKTPKQLANLLKFMVLD